MPISLSDAEGWLLLRAEAVPDSWSDRAVDVSMVPLLPGEVDGILADGRAVPALSPEEEALIHLVAAGKSIDTIGRQLQIGKRTVDRRLERIRRRFGIETKAEMATFFARKGFGE